jgi:DNA processing protein
MNNDLKYWLGLSRITGLGAVRMKRLYNYFPSMAAAWQASSQELKMAGLEEKLAERIIIEREEMRSEEFLEVLEKEGIKAVTVLEEDYPKLLKEIYSPPAVLYYRGELKGEGDEFAIGVVGTRKFSSYGKQLVEDIVGGIARQGITIVSGLALGIDSLAHETAINSQARTISVLGSGLARQNIYPSSNRYLADRIISSGGLMVSEYPPEMMPLKENFPQRNRIIAGLSVASLIIEAPESSGALITAQYALEFNRDVMAIPGNIYNVNAEGVNNLIKLGAKLITSANDVLEALNLKQATNFIENKKISPDNEEEEIILNIISREPVHINEIIKNSGFDTAKINSILILMEMKGKVKNLGNMMYVVGR